MEYGLFAVVSLVYLLAIWRDQQKTYKGPYFSASGTIWSFWYTVGYLLFALGLAFVLKAGGEGLPTFWVFVGSVIWVGFVWVLIR